jgi:prepilin-type processing-associated H-X9-DG protein
MQRQTLSSRRAFSLTELLVILVVILVIAALSLVAIQQVRVASTQAKCGNNLRQIGIALHNYLGDYREVPYPVNLESAIAPYLESQQKRMFTCPLEKDGRSYAINTCSWSMDRTVDGLKVLMMDGHEVAIQYTGLDEQSWYDSIAPRHNGFMNVLYLDGHVANSRPSPLNPYDANEGPINVDRFWKPERGSCHGCEAGDGSPTVFGITGTLFDYSNTGYTDIYPSIYCPFGGGLLDPTIPYSIHLHIPGAPANSSAGLSSSRWTGSIRADTTGNYYFFVSCDNEARVFVNGAQILYRVTGGGGVVQWQTSASPVYLVANQWVPIEILHVEYVQGTPCHVALRWSTSSDQSTMTNIPQHCLRPW